jgi:hypothetical protein
VARWGPFRCLVLSGLVINFCNKIRYNKDIGILCLHSDRMYDNLILCIHMMSIWFWVLKTGCDKNLIQMMNLPNLGEPFSPDEIQAALQDMPSDHALGPDNFNGRFMKKCWEIIKEGFSRLFNQFVQRYINLEFINGSFITLIPKKDNLGTVNDFRPISLLNSSLKLLTKLLATQLQSAIKSVIHLNQYGFIQ